ncbi:hypothetical protein JCM8097_007831 [Rhodosporidiobolus ruineniae]
MTALPPSLDYPVHGSPLASPNHNPNAPSPAPSSSSKRKASDVGGVEAYSGRNKGKGRAKEVEEDEGDGSDDGGGEGRKKKRNRMALSCKECKRRKIKCDRVMPVCGNCAKRNRPTDCTWDVFQPANDAFLPPTLARTAEVETLAARLAHVERYLATLPPNFALFRPFAGVVPSRTVVGAAENGEGMRRAIAAPPGGEKDEEGYSDTEDAAVKLENGVFSGRLELDAPASSSASRAYALPAPPPAILPRQNSQRPPGAPAGPATRFGAPALELTSALTSIVSSSPPPSAALMANLMVDFDATPEEQFRARREAVEKIVRALPGRAVVEVLVERYFASVAWLFNHLHAPTFRAELDAFHALCDQSRAADVDLFWLALLLMVLCLALDSLHFRRSPPADPKLPSPEDGDEERATEDPLLVYSEEQRRESPERWFAASMRALRLAEWETVPRVRTIQTIVLYTQYLQLSSASRGQPAHLALWLAGAIRLSQVLGLHLLGSNPETMPPEDPAWPPGRNSLKREMAKRLWAVLVYQDWLGANSRNRSYLISPLHFDTDDPSNVNDADLSPSTTSLQPAPASVLTDSSASRVRIAMARQVRAVFDRIVLSRDGYGFNAASLASSAGPADPSSSGADEALDRAYSTVLELDAGFRSILDDLPERWKGLEADERELEQPMRRFQRHFVLEGLHNRIFRLHRPLLGRAGKMQKYRFSADACLKSARAVVVSTHNIREAVADIPYTYSHVLGAALVLFNDLFQAIDHDLSAPEIDSKLSTLHLAQEIFSCTPTSPALAHVVSQGHRILTGLFREEERRRTTRAARALVLASSGGIGVEGAADGLEEDEQETFAEVLHRIARSLNADSAPHRGTPPPTRNIPTKGEGRRGGGATFAAGGVGDGASAHAGAADTLSSLAQPVGGPSSSFFGAGAPALTPGLSAAVAAAHGFSSLSSTLPFPSSAALPAPPPLVSASSGLSTTTLGNTAVDAEAVYPFPAPPPSALFDLSSYLGLAGSNGTAGPSSGGGFSATTAGGGGAAGGGSGSGGGMTLLQMYNAGSSSATGFDGATTGGFGLSLGGGLGGADAGLGLGLNVGGGGFAMDEDGGQEFDLGLGGFDPYGLQPFWAAAGTPAPVGAAAAGGGGGAAPFQPQQDAAVGAQQSAADIASMSAAEFWGTGA